MIAPCAAALPFLRVSPYFISPLCLCVHDHADAFDILLYKMPVRSFEVRRPRARQDHQRHAAAARRTAATAFIAPPSLARVLIPCRGLPPERTTNIHAMMLTAHASTPKHNALNAEAGIDHGAYFCSHPPLCPMLMHDAARLISEYRPAATVPRRANMQRCRVCGCRHVTPAHVQHLPPPVNAGVTQPSRECHGGGNVTPCATRTAPFPASS